MRRFTITKLQRLDVPVERVIAFSDGVFAIVITLLVLEITVGNGDAWQDLRLALPQLGVFAWSFFLIAQFWQLHTHLFALLKTKRVSSAVSDSNIGLLFFVALVPFATKFLNSHFHQMWGLVVYAAVVTCIGLAQLRLRAHIIQHGKKSGADTADIWNALPYLITPIAMALSIPAAILSPWVAYALWAFVLVTRGRQMLTGR